MSEQDVFAMNKRFNDIEDLIRNIIELIEDIHAVEKQNPPKLKKKTCQTCRFFKRPGYQNLEAVYALLTKNEIEIPNYCASKNQMIQTNNPSYCKDWSF